MSAETAVASSTFTQKLNAPDRNGEIAQALAAPYEKGPHRLRDQLLLGVTATSVLLIPAGVVQEERQGRMFARLEKGATKRTENEGIREEEKIRIKYSEVGEDGRNKKKEMENCQVKKCIRDKTEMT